MRWRGEEGKRGASDARYDEGCCWRSPIWRHGISSSSGGGSGGGGFVIKLAVAALLSFMVYEFILRDLRVVGEAFD